MKILIIHNHYLEKGGEDEVVNAEVALLREHGHDVILYEKSNEYVENAHFIKKSLFTLFDINFSKIVYGEISDIVRSEKPDIAHIHNIFVCITPSVYFALNKFNVPIVQSLHNYRLFCIRGTFYNRSAICERCLNHKPFGGVIRKCWRGSFFSSFFLTKLLQKKESFLKNIYAYIALSKFSRNKFAEMGLDRSKLHLKTNFLTIEPEGGGQDHDYALFVGRLVDYKGVATLMKAFNAIPSFRLKIVGDGPLKSEVQRFVSTHSNVEWLGRLNRASVNDVMRNCSFLIFPSEWYEGMPMVILESFVFSKPILASNLGAMKELVADGVNGVLFEPGNAEDLAAKIAYMFTHKDKRIEMGKNANKIYRQQFIKEKNYEELLNIYTRTIETKKSRSLSLALTYSIADQNFKQAKSLGVFNVSTKLMENLSLRGTSLSLNLLTNSSLSDKRRSLSCGAFYSIHNEAVGNKLGRIVWDQWGVYAAARRSGCQWLLLPKGFTSFFKPRGFKLAVYIHDAMHDYYNNNYSGVMSQLEIMYFTRSLKAALKYSSVIFTNSEFSKSEVKRLASSFKIKLPPVIVAGIGFTRTMDAVPEKRNSLILLTSFWPHKLTELAMDYVNCWHDETGFSGNIELIGSLPSSVRLPGLPNWRHHHRLSETMYRQLLAEAKALLFFSAYEGFGMPPVEAMIAGTCPVFSDLPVTREVMGERGFSFSNDSYKSFAQAMNKALNVPETQIQLWAAQLLELHNWGKVVDRVSNGLLRAGGRAELTTRK